MGLIDALKLNDPDVDPNEIDRRMAGNGLPPEGMHHAQLDGYRSTTANSGTKGHELTFLILAGAGQGMRVKECVWEPKGEDADKDKKAVDKLRLYCHRLGLLKKVTENGKSRYVPAEGKDSFSQCYGAQVVIDVQHEDDTWTNDKGKEIRSKKARLTFEGVIPLDDKRCEKVPKGKAVPVAAAADALAPQSAGTRPAPANSRDYSDLNV